MNDESAVEFDSRPWTLAALADEAEFDRHVEAAATAIADRYTLNGHINLAARRRAYQDFIDGVRLQPTPLDYRAFVGVCAALIAALSTHRVVTFSAMSVAPNQIGATVLRYGNEVAALAAGGALYAAAVEGMTASQSGETLSAFLWENAAASLRRQPEETAVRFRELLRLPTPWM
jgi:hypothetical protein